METMTSDTGDGMARLVGSLVKRPDNDAELEDALSVQIAQIAGAPVRVLGVAAIDGRPVPLAVMAASEDARTVAVALLEGYGFQVVSACTHPPAELPVIWTDGPALDPDYPAGEWWAWLDRAATAEHRKAA